MYYMQSFSKYGLISYNNLLFHGEHFFTGISLLIALYKSTVDQHFIVFFTVYFHKRGPGDAAAGDL